MFLKLGEEIFDVVLIDQVVAFHDQFGGGAAVHGLQYFLLVAQGDLGIGDKEGREQCIGLLAFFTVYTLDTEAYGMGKIFHCSVIMAEKNQAAFFCAGTFDHVQL